MGALLPGGIKELVSLRGTHWRAKGENIDSLTDDEVLSRLLEDPLFLRRPILWEGDSVRIGWKSGDYQEADAGA